VSINDVKHVHTDTDSDDTSLAGIQPPHTAAANFSTTYSDIGNTLCLQHGEWLLLLRRTPSASKVKPY